MSSDLIVRPEQAPAAMTTRQLEFIATTDFIPKGLRGNLPAIMACVQTGRALGLPDMAALRSIHIVDGKATFSAELMVSLVRRAGHSITGETGDGTATVRGRRGDNADEMAVTWTLAMAERAGLKGKQNWQRYPEAMLWARAVSQLCRMLFADVFIGATYTPEEIGEQHTNPEGLPIDEITHQDDDALFPPSDDASPVRPSEAQIKKLNVLVGRLREAGTITTEDVYRMANRGGVDQDGNWDFIDHLDESGELHWSPLRDVLTKAEAHELIDWLEGFKRPGLSFEALQEWIGASGADKDHLAMIAKDLYPEGTGFKALTDEQRLEVRQRYEQLVST